MGIFALSTLIVTGAGIFLLSKVFPNFQPGNKKIQADLQHMREETTEESGDLVPLAVKDLELLASEEEDRSVKKGFTTFIRGKFTTIFHEPVVLFRYKKYLSSTGKDAALYARTAQHEYFFWIKGKGTRLVIDNRFIGTLEDERTLVGGKRNKVIALLKREEEEYIPVLIEGREVGSIAKRTPRQASGLSTRAFGYVRDDLSDEEQIILMALTIHELLTQHLK